MVHKSNKSWVKTHGINAEECSESVFMVAEPGVSNLVTQEAILFVIY